MSMRKWILAALACVALLGLSAPALRAQETKPAQTKKETTQEEKKPEKQEDPARKPDEKQPENEEQPGAKKPEEQPRQKPAIPDLDELLGLPKADKDKPAQEEEPAQPVDPNQGELERALSGEQIAEAFVEAIKQMGDAAAMLREARDPGLPTQRVQEEIIRKLDALIEQAEQQQQRQQQQQQGQQQQDQQAPAQPQQASQRQQAGQGDNRDERMPPPPEDARFAGWLEDAKARWGALPARLRDALIQGSGDSYSALYEALTREYYRKLAEQEPDRP